MGERGFNIPCSHYQCGPEMPGGDHTPCSFWWAVRRHLCTGGSCEPLESPSLGLRQGSLSPTALAAELPQY